MRQLLTTARGGARGVLATLGLGRTAERPLVARHLKRREGSFLARHLPEGRVDVRPGAFAAIEERARATTALGRKPLWQGYAALDASYAKPGGDALRSPAEVRTDWDLGALYARLAAAARPEVVVEFGAAFGVSGMYWLSALEANGRGRLLTFEPNAEWAEIARGNLSSVGSRFRLVVDTFEDAVDRTLPEGSPIDLAMIDAIHTGAFVRRQFALVVERARPGALVVLDDVNFSEDMAACWRAIAHDPRVAASVDLRRAGIVELA